MSEKKKQTNLFTIVGIGASAGGLRALEAFFKSVSTTMGVAFIVVQHLSPDYESQLPSILARYTTMPVYQITKDMNIDPDTVYIIPPKYNLEIKNNKLQLMEIIEPHIMPAKIDVFFQSLAEALWELAIGIILSGSGSDGMLGLRAIKQYGGMTMAQTPETAKYASMPQHAINSGIVDFVAPPEDLPSLLMDYLYNVPPISDLQVENQQNNNDYLNRIFRLLMHHTGHDFSLYKRNTIVRRIMRRMVLTKTSNLSQYAHNLQQNKHERDRLFRELLIGVTQFFRDPFTFDVLREKVLPHLLEGTETHQPIRVWVSGCSTGEEAYSITMTLHDFFGADIAEEKLQVFATDINPESIQWARQGVYSVGIAKDVPPEYLKKYFIKEDNGYRIASHIRKLVIFAEHDILKDAPFSNLNLVSFRNVLIYLYPQIQQKVFEILRYALKPDGVLFLGTSETLGASRDNFKVIDSSAKLFQLRKTHAKPKSILEIQPNKHILVRNTQEVFMMTNQQMDLRPFIEKLLLQNFVSACVITDTEGDILYFHNRTGKYLEPATGNAKLNVLQMARQGLQMTLTTAFHKAVKSKQDILYENLEVVTNGDTQLIHLIIHTIQEPEELNGLILIMFEDARRQPMPDIDLSELDTNDARDQLILNLKRELKTEQEFLQTTREALETSNEELKSTNEELQSANEELQSTNEELETSKEEVNSINEELMSANAELQTQIEAFSLANNDLQNLLNTIEIGIIFLDMNLNIQRFNPAVNRLFNVIESDVGRSITHITSNFKQERLVEDIQAVLDTLSSQSIEISTSNDIWYVIKIRPYRTIDNIIDGVVITFNDVSEQKKREQANLQHIKEIKETQAYAEAIINTTRHPFLVLDHNFTIISSNHAFYNLFHVAQEQTAGKSLFDLGNGQWNILELKELLITALTENTFFEDFIVEHDFPLVGHKKVILNASRLEYETNNSSLILLAIEDITEQH